MVVAQHFGLPTRLLDWSESPLAASFFAVENNEFKYDEDDNPVVWCLNPLILNEQTDFLKNSEVVPNIMATDEDFFRNLKSNFYDGDEASEYPIAIISPENNKRINAQKGVFTLFSLKAKCLESLARAEDFLIKVIISKDEKINMKMNLFDMGITYANIFPELEYISKDIKFNYLRKN